MEQIKWAPHKQVIALAVPVALLLAGCSSMSTGSPAAKTVATGAAAGGNATNANSNLERCPAPLGTISLVEDTTSDWYQILTREYKLPPSAKLLRLIVQQSNCFVIVERSEKGMAAMQRERELMKEGQSRAGSNFGKGKMVASDFALSPEVLFSGNTGGVGAGLGGLLPGKLGLVAGVAGSAKSSEASVMLTIVDNRSGVQISAAEGSAKNWDFGGIGGLLGGSGVASLGGYSKTPMGKVLTTAFFDAYNQTVVALRGYKAQQVKGGLGKGGGLKVGN